MEKRSSGKMARAAGFILLFIFSAIPASNANAVLLKIPAVHHRPQIFDIHFGTTHILDIDYMAGVIDIDYGRSGIIEIDYDTNGRFDFDRGKLGRIDMEHLFGHIDIDHFRGPFKVRPHDHGSSQSAPVPEPATMLLLGAGMLGLAAGMRRKRRG